MFKFSVESVHIGGHRDVPASERLNLGRGEGWGGVRGWIRGGILSLHQEMHG